MTRAYDELSAALGQDPANPRIRYYFGAVLEQGGDVQAAVDSYWFVVDEAGTDGGFGLLAARALQRLGYIAP
jgi:cytochrome c-type biogenesis protein CcmH/NrfG